MDNNRETDNPESLLVTGDSSGRRLSANIYIITDEVRRGSAPNMVAIDS